MRQRAYSGLAVFLVAIVLAVSGVGDARTANSAEDNTLFVNLTSDDPWTASI